MSRILVEVILDLLAFLELSPDEVVDPDAAVEQMEAVSAKLQQLPTNERAALVSMVEAIASEQPGGARREFVKSVPAALGLV